MEIQISAEPKRFIKWIRHTFDGLPQEFLSFKVEENDFLLTIGYYPPIDDPIDYILYPEFEFLGVYANYPYKPDLNLEDIELGTIEIRDLSENMVLVDIDSSDPNFDTIMFWFLDQIKKTWPGQFSIIDYSDEQLKNLFQQYNYTPLPYDFLLIRLWRSGKTAEQISIEISKDHKITAERVTNHISELRGIFKEINLLPYRKSTKKAVKGE